MKIEGDVKDMPEIDLVKLLLASPQTNLELSRTLKVSVLTIRRWKRGVARPHPMAHAAIVAALETTATEQSKARERALDQVFEALAFYANPNSYFALAVMADPPGGEFATDMSALTDDDKQYFEDYRPGDQYYGKKAREALAAWRSTRVAVKPE